MKKLNVIFLCLLLFGFLGFNDSHAGWKDKFERSKEKLKEVHSISGHFEYSQISLILLYKELETLEIEKIMK